jgi:outer membrane protein OmpA-like peptidoglycan-associated protein
MKTITKWAMAALFAAAAGCASAQPPPELTSARTAYDRAARGPAGQLDPADVHVAKESLQAAEQAFANDGDSRETRDIAYTAERRAQIAESRARAIEANKQKDQAVAEMQSLQAQQVRLTSAELGRAKQQILTQDQQLQNERARREEAEKRAQQAAADLARIATVKQETRGMVITLSGSVLFASGKSELLPAAQTKLNDVAEALTKQDPDAKMVVEGHTDSQGDDAFNQKLSQARAESVRAYLVSRGIAADRITAQGVGESRPIADNASAEGRANNRRVEIVVQPTSGSSGSSGPSTTTPQP